MFRPRVIPCLLLKDKGLVKTIKFRDPTYVGDPINAVKIFNEQRADELVFLDITASKEDRIPSVDVIQKIGDEAFMPFSVGGGIKSIADIRQILNAGAEKVVLNSHVINNPTFLSEAAAKFGSQSIIVSIDVKKNGSDSYDVFTHGGTRQESVNLLQLVTDMGNAGAGEIMINSIDRDGTGEGYDLSLIKQVSERVSIPVIAVGGAGKWQDFNEAVKEGNASAVAAGSLFVFIGRKRAVLINYPGRDEIEEIFKNLDG